MLKKTLIILFLNCICFSTLFAQDSALAINNRVTLSSDYIFKRIIEDGDTILYSVLPDVRIYGRRIFKNPKEASKYNKLVYNVKKVYPYAKVAGELLEKYGAQIDSMKSEKEKKKYLNMVEEELKQQYKGELTKLSITQGIILVKLVDRETSRTSYEIVKEMRGTFSAFFWQQIAKLFDNNLKAKYDPYGEDKEIEEIVDMIEHGEI